MGRQEGRVVKPLEYCLEKAKRAIEDQSIPELREEIIHGELSADKVWREAQRRLKELRVTKDLNPEDEGLATSYWWLAKTKRDHREGLEKEIKQEERTMDKVMVYCGLCGEATAAEDLKEFEEREVYEDGVTRVRANCLNCRSSLEMFILPEGKIPITQIRFEIPHGAIGLELRTKMRYADPSFPPQAEMRFLSGQDLVAFCSRLLFGLFEDKVDFHPSDRKYVMKEASVLCLKVLEEKLGIKVRTCGSCQHYAGEKYIVNLPISEENPFRLFCRESPGSEHIVPFESFFKACERWKPKKVSAGKQEPPMHHLDDGDDG
jgi:hypothetical protein